MTKKQPESVTDQLKRAMDECGLTRYRISKETGINESHLSKFYRGERGLSMEALNAIGRLLDLKLTLGIKSTKPKKGT